MSTATVGLVLFRCTSTTTGSGPASAACHSSSTKIRERILTEETITELMTLVAEEIDAMAGELAGRLEVIEAELGGREEAA